MAEHNLKCSIEKTNNWEILCWRENRFTKEKLLIREQSIVKGSIKNVVTPNATTASMFDLCSFIDRSRRVPFSGFSRAESKCKLDNDSDGIVTSLYIDKFARVGV